MSNSERKVLGALHTTAVRCFLNSVLRGWPPYTASPSSLLPAGDGFLVANRIQVEKVKHLLGREAGHSH